MTFLDALVSRRYPTDEPSCSCSTTSPTTRAIRCVIGGAAAGRIQPFFLPAYAPQLNLIERLWRYLKAHFANHRCWNDLERLQQATHTLLDRLTVHFHPNEGPAFHLLQNFRTSAYILPSSVCQWDNTDESRLCSNDVARHCMPIGG